MASMYKNVDTTRLDLYRKLVTTTSKCRSESASVAANVGAELGNMLGNRNGLLNKTICISVDGS